MPTPGKGFLAIWNDTVPELDGEWVRWHTREHMIERVGVPGFLAGRRYLDAKRDIHRYFTLYEGADVAVFSSAAYLERLNNPTPWTRQTASYFRNFLRSACRTVADAGAGTGGVLGTVQLNRAVDTPRQQAVQELVAGLVDARGILRARIGLSDAGVSGIETEERRLRPEVAPPSLDGVLLVDGLDRSAVAAALTTASEKLSALGLKPTAQGIYDLSITLDKPDLGL
jgi:hypothetical protein